MKTIEVQCDHVCSGECRRSGCNCQCGEFHQEATTLTVQHLPSDYPTDAPSVDELLIHLGKQTGFNLETTEDEGDRTAADYADAEPLATE
jgi:hypothetical protein